MTQSELSQLVARVFLGASDPMSMSVVAEACEQVQMFRVDGRDEDFDTVLGQFANHFDYDERPKMRRDPHRIARHQCLREFEQRVIRPAGGWFAIVSVDMLAVVSGAPSARVTPQPRSVGVNGHVVPVVPRFLRVRTHDTIMCRSSR